MFLFSPLSTGHHKSNGITGSLIIREPRENDLNSELYDYDLSEHIMFTNDWIHEYAETFVPGLPGRVLEPKSILINGKGRFDKVMTVFRSSVI